MKYFSLLVAALLGATAIFANEVECPFTSINTDITSNTTLSASTLYRVEGCVRVTTGKTLTIPAATVVLFQKSSNAALVIEKGARLIVNGTSSNPVIFTSDQIPGDRLPGDFQGLYILGNAPNNVSGGSITLNEKCSVTGGGSNTNDSSGVIRYLNIHYAKNAITLIGVGNKTVMDHIMVSQASGVGMRFLGSDARVKYSIVQDAAATAYEFNFGDKTKMQYGIALTKDVNAHVASGTNAIVISNNNTSPYTATPASHPVLSNFSILNILYCGATGVSSDFKNGVLYRHGAEGGVYNSVIAGSPVGLRMEDATTLNNADVNDALLASENSFYGNTTQYNHNGSWPGFCAFDMTDWIKGTAGGSCAQFGNQLQTPAYTLGYSSAICTSSPSFLLVGTTGLLNSSYPTGTDLANSFFTTTVQKHGALNSTSVDWTASWAKWNTQGLTVCPGARPTGLADMATDKNNSLNLFPNPVNGVTYAEFNSEKAGEITIHIVNSVGQVVRSIKANTTSGEQRIAISTEGLSAGIYIIDMINVQGDRMKARLVIK